MKLWLVQPAWRIVAGWLLLEAFVVPASLFGAVVPLQEALVQASEKLDEPGVFFLQLNSENTYTGSVSVGFLLELDCNGAVLDFSANQGAGTFAGITILPDQLLRIRNGTIRHADVALSYRERTTALVESMDFRSCEQGVAHPGNGSVTVKGCTFLEFPAGNTWAMNVGFSGIDGATNLVTEQNTINGARFGIQAQTGSSVTVSGSSFLNLEQSISLAGGSLSVTGLNTFLGAQFAHVTATNYFGNRPEIFLSGQRLENATFGLQVVRSQVVLEGTTLSNCDQGISAQGGATELTGCTVESSQDTGVMILPTTSGEAPVVTLEDCIIRTTPFGVSLQNAEANLLGCTLEDVAQGVVAQGGELTLQDSTFGGFLAGQETFAVQLLLYNGTRATATLERVNTEGADFGLLARNARLDVVDCVFERHEQGIALLQGTGDFSVPTTITGTQIRDCSVFGLNVPDGGFLQCDNTSVIGCKTGIELEEGVNATLSSMTINGLGVLQPGVGIGAINQVTLLVENSTFQGHLNSIYVEKDSLLTVRQSQLLDPCFSGIIFYDNTTILVEESQFLRNGQDGIFTDIEVLEGATSRSVRPCFGTIKGNVFDECGIGELDSDCLRFNVAGTGIALLGAGNFTVEDNQITRSRDTGIALLKGATAAIRRNRILNNGGTGILLDNAGNAEVTENLIAFHTNPQQAGIQLFGQNASLNFKRNMIHGNTDGLINKESADFQYWTENLLSDQLKNGFLIEEGRADGIRNVFIENQDYQVFCASPERSGLPGGMMFSTSRKGVYTTTSAALTWCIENWWGGASAINESFSVVPQSRMGYQNADTTQYLTLPNQEVGLFRPGKPNIIISRSTTPWVDWSGGTLSSTALLAIIRPQTPDTFPVPPPGALVAQPYFLWSTSGFAAISESVVLQLQETLTAENAVALARYNELTGAWEPVALVIGPATGANGLSILFLPGVQPLGTYHWVELSTPPQPQGSSLWVF